MPRDGRSIFVPYKMDISTVRGGRILSFQEQNERCAQGWAVNFCFLQNGHFHRPWRSYIESQERGERYVGGLLVVSFDFRG